MKKFRFKYPTMVWVLLAVVMVLATAGLCWNVYNFISFVGEDTANTVIYAIVVLLNAFLVVVAFSVGIYGTYAVKGDKLYSYFGIIRTKYEINDIVEITHFKKSDKLVAYFKDDKFTVIVIDPSQYDNFVLAIREVNKQIIFDKKIEGENTPD